MVGGWITPDFCGMPRIIVIGVLLAHPWQHRAVRKSSTGVPSSFRLGHWRCCYRVP
jgi:hypothetical protein